MQEKYPKLTLNQETLRQLTNLEPDWGFGGNPHLTHTCRSVCGLPCTPKLGKN